MRLIAVPCLLVLLTPAQATDPAQWKALDQELVRLTAQGNFAAALPVALEALDVARRFGPEDPRYVDGLISTGALSHHLGKRPEAERAIREGISIVRGKPGREEELSKLLDHLATFYYEYGGRGREVEALRREAVELAIQSLGPRHARVGFLFSHLALSLIDRHRYDEAKVMLTQALELADERAFPVFAGDIYMSLGAVASAQRQYSEAIRFFDRARGLFAGFGGETSPRTILPLLALGEAYLKLGRAAEAEESIARALVLAESALGPDNLRTAEILAVQAGALRALGKRKEAREVERRARAIVTSLAGEVRAANSRVHISDLVR